MARWKSKPSTKELNRQWQAMLDQPGTTMTVLIVADISSVKDKREALPEKYRDQAQENRDYTALLNGGDTGKVQAWALSDLPVSQYRQLLTDFSVWDVLVHVQTISHTGPEGEVYSISSAVVKHRRKSLSLEIFLTTGDGAPLEVSPQEEGA